VPGATVKLTNLATNIQSTTTTNDIGDYQFLNVKVGTYEITAEREGFSTARAE
jgi:hypothetical protein